MNYFKQINESFERLHKNVLEEDKSKKLKEVNTSRKSLDEALPKNLMNQIKQTRSARYNNSYNGGFNTGDAITSNGMSTGISDYDKATYKEISDDEVMAMKKAGSDLSNVYILKKGYGDDYHMIKLDRDGRPDDRGSTTHPRLNQSLKKSLEGADKIYVAKIPDLMQSDPEKARTRLSNPEVRKSNYNLGHNRNWGFNKSETRGGSSYAKYKRDQSGNKSKIDVIKAQYDAGNISRNEMERQIAALKDTELTPDNWRVQEYNKIRNRNAENRYKTSELTLKQPRNDLKQYRDELKDAKWNVFDAQSKLDRVKTGARSKYDGYEGDYNNNKQKIAEYQNRIKNLQDEIVRTQNEIERLSKLVNDDARQADLDKYQKNLDDQIAKMNGAQAKIDKLLKRK